MKVKNLILYQVATDRNYRVGEILTFNKDIPNGQYNRVFNSDFRLNDNRPSDKLYEVAQRRFKKFKSEDDIYSIAHILEYYDVAIKEIALEEVRKQQCPTRPSRLHCMYLSLNKDTALKNAESMFKNREKNGNHFQVVAVKLNGDIFKAGRVYVNRESKSYEYYKEKAKAYWRQRGLKDDEVKEVLFEGEAEIVEVLKEYRR